LITRSGGRLASGRLHRSAELCQLAPWQAATFSRTIGLRTVIDLRTTFELTERGSAALGSPCRTVHLPLFEMALPHWVDSEDQSPAAVALRYLEMLEHGTESVARLVGILGETDALPAIVHCAAGRDRTGIVIACLLDLLDVPDELIAADYALSDGAVQDGAAANPETALHFLAALRERYGSTGELLGAHGASHDAVEKLRRALTIPQV
jgi:protein-tyrosine phosphatase